MSSKGYNVPIRNSFAQLDSDAESDYETVPKKVTSEVAAATTQRRERTTRAVNQEPSDARQRSHVEDRPSRGGRGRFRGSSRVAAPLGGEMQPQSPTAIDEEPLAGENLFGNRGRRGVGRADRRGRGFIGRGREFERHSGSGRGREMKKSGAGGYNWGSPVERAENISTMPSNREAPLSGRPL